MRILWRSLVVVTLLLVAGCSGGGADATSEGAVGASDSGGDGAALDSGADMAGEESAEEPAADVRGGVVPAVEDRQFITEGSVTVTVDKPRRAAAEVATMVERLGGHVQERVEDGRDDEGTSSAFLVVRIPSNEVSGALEQLGALGTVEDTSITSTEVTAQARDLDARIRALEISVERLEGLLSRATTTEAIVSAEQALTERQSELESLQSQRNRLADQVALATLRIDLWTQDTVPPEPPTGFWGGLVTGWNSLVATVTGLLLALGVLLPWAVVIGLIVVLALALRRRRRRTDRSGPTATAPSGPTTPPGGQGPATPADVIPASEPTAAPASPAPAPASTSTSMADLAAGKAEPRTESPSPAAATPVGPAAAPTPRPRSAGRTAKPRTTKDPAGDQ